MGYRMVLRIVNAIFFLSAVVDYFVGGSYFGFIFFLLSMGLSAYYCYFLDRGSKGDGILIDQIERVLTKTLLRSRASEPCSLAFRVRANKEYAPNVWFSGAQTWSHKLSIRTMFAGTKGLSTQCTCTGS